MESLSQRQARRFLEWEKRGRGWTHWGRWVDPEPPFVSFHTFQSRDESEPVDDGRVPTIFSSIATGFRSLFEESRSQPSKEGLEVAELEAEDDTLELFADGRVRLTELRLSLPLEYAGNVPLMGQFLRSLANCTYPLTYQIFGTPADITCLLILSEDDAPLVYDQLAAHFPEIVIIEGTKFFDTLAMISRGTESCIFEVGLSEPFMIPPANEGVRCRSSGRYCWSSPIAQER